MNLETATSFFMWCTIFDGAILIFWTVCFLFMPNFLYQTQKRWFPLPQETFFVVMYGFLGVFKLLFLVFNLIPWLALLMLG